MEYELIREIFNQCSGNQMRDVFVSEIETEDPERYLRDLFPGKELEYDLTVTEDGSYIFDLVVDSLHQRYSFTPV